MADSEKVLEVDGVVSGYGDLEILHGVYLEVRAGEVVALIGSNGAGKTTLMRTLTGLLKVRTGDVRLAGKSLRRLPPPRIVRAGMSLVPEGRQVFSDLSVEDNLMVGAWGIGRADRDRRIGEVYDRFPVLADRRRQDAGSLSGGEQQMLALGRALVRQPLVLLLDEPSMGLAPIVVEHMFEAIGSLKSTGVSVLLVEQNVVAALSLADRGYVIESGEITRAGSGQELLDDPRLSASFLGYSGDALDEVEPAQEIA